MSDTRDLRSNDDARLMCLLLLDSSQSMAGAPCLEINEDLQSLEEHIKSDVSARRHLDVAVITFGNDTVSELHDFVTAAEFSAPQLHPLGAGPLGEAVKAGLNMIHKRKLQLREQQRDYYRPWVYLLTATVPILDTDSENAFREAQYEMDKNALAFVVRALGGADTQMFHKFNPYICEHTRPFYRAWVERDTPGIEDSLPTMGFPCPENVVGAPATTPRRLRRRKLFDYWK